MDPMAVADSATQANMMAVVKRQRMQDFFFHKITMGFSLLVLCALMGIIISLLINAWPSFAKFGLGFARVSQQGFHLGGAEVARVHRHHAVAHLQGRGLVA